jgi:hypothetical protein
MDFKFRCGFFPDEKPDGRQMKSEDFLVSQLISFSNWEKLWATGEGRIPS